jgi:hypothetical protein
MKHYRVVLLLLIAAVCSAQTPRICAVVAGCESTINEKKWKDFRIGFGVSNIIADELYTTGRFMLREEKNDVKDKLTTLRQRLWSGAYKDVQQTIDSIKTDSSAVVYGRLVYFGTPRQSVCLGPFGSCENAVIIKTEVVLVTPDGTRYVGKGEGISTRRAMGTLFKYSDDGVFFEQTEIGNALHTAIVKATADCMTHYSPKDSLP